MQSTAGSRQEIGAPPEPPGDGGGSASGGAGAAQGAVSAHPHRVWVRVVLTFATVLAVFAIFAVWANRQLLNPTNWSKTSTALLQKPTVRAALSTYLVDQLYQNVNVQAQLQSALPPTLSRLAGPIAGGLQNLAQQGAERALDSPRVQDVWSRANYFADEQLVRIVTGGGPRVQVSNGNVILNLRAILANVLQRLGLPTSLAAKLPASAATITVVKSKNLGLVQDGAKALHALSVVLVALVLVLYALALLLARGYRRHTLMWVGGSLIIAGLVVLLVRRITGNQLVPVIAKNSATRPAAYDVYSVATGLLVQVAGAALIIGIPVLAAGWFAGPAKWATGARRWLAPHLSERPWLGYAITATLLLLVFIWGPIPATRNIWWMLFFTVLAFAGTEILRRQIEEQFPAHPAQAALQ